MSLTTLCKLGWGLVFAQSINRSFLIRRIGLVIFNFTFFDWMCIKNNDKKYVVYMIYHILNNSNYKLRGYL